MRGLLVLAALVAATSAQAAARPETTPAEEEAVADVRLAIAHRDCGRAVSKLNQGLANKYPDIYLMAGTMYEEGICLKADWERAATMYRRAFQAGHEGGVLRLIAGSAYKQRDPAAALWWASKHRPDYLVGPCRSGMAVVDSPESFVATLRTWSAEQVHACVYVAGVMAAVSGDTEFPADQAVYAMSGEVEMNFVPATGTMTWKTTDLQMINIAGVVDGDTSRERNLRRARLGFQTYLEGIGAKVLARFARPEGIDPTWTMNTSYVFNFSYR